MKIDREAVLYLMERVNISEDGCWNWTKSKDKDGYGYAKFVKRAKAHRLSFQVFNNTSDEEMSEKVVCHMCDNPSCINPNHLFLGTQFDNNHDMISKRRDNFAFTRLRKLTEEEVITIRQEYAEAKQRGKLISYVSLASKYGVSNVTIRNLLLGKTYKRVKGSLQ